VDGPRVLQKRKTYLLLLKTRKHGMCLEKIKQQTS